MRRLLFIIIGLLSLAACKTDKTSVPQEFECFNQPHIYIKYKQPINGYTVKVMWLQYGEVGNALFCLEKQGVQYYSLRRNGLIRFCMIRVTHIRTTQL